MFKRITLLPSRQRRFRLLFTAFAVLLSCLLLPGLFAQTDFASIRGTVMDNTGAVISTASIQLQNLDTGAKQAAVSDASGNFHFEALVRGNYQATVSAKGFQNEVQAFTLLVSQIQAINFKLNPGSVNTTVEVTDAAPIVDTSTSSTGTVVEAQQIVEG